MTFSHLRRDYSLASLDRPDVDPDPIVQFQRWFDDAQRAEIVEANAMTLATCSASGHPSARIVLLKEVDARGFVFYTDYRSQKGRELADHAFAALVFFWKDIERQVRVSGRVERVSRQDSEMYFQTRPVGSRVGAWASEQSTVIPGREWLEGAVAEVAARFPHEDVPLPPHWGGFRVVPDAVEFWQGRASRLHDRLRYQLSASGWQIDRLSP